MSDYFFQKMIKIFFNFGFCIADKYMKIFNGVIFHILGFYNMEELFYYRKFLTEINDWDFLTASKRYRPLWQELLESKGDISNIPLESKANLIRIFPQYFNTQDCLECVGYFYVFSDIPQDLLNEEIIIYWFTGINQELKRCPLELRTRNVCLAACKSSPLNLQYVPRHMRDYEMCAIACETQRFHNDEKNFVITSKALYGSHSCLQHVPKIHRYLLSHMFLRWDGVIYDNKKEWVKSLKN